MDSSNSPTTHRFVFDGGTGHTQVELAVLLDAGVNQGLDRGLFLEQQKGVAWGKKEQTHILRKKNPNKNYTSVFNSHNLVTVML